MSLKSKTQAIEGFNYIVTQLPADEGTEMLARFINLISAGVGGLSWEGKLSAEQIGPVLGSVMGNPQLADHLKYFCGLFQRYTQVEINGNTTNLGNVYSVHFAGRYFAQMQWLKFCLEVNLGDFLDKIRGTLASVLPQVPTGSSSQSPQAQGPIG
jgi:hypothetical protein